MLLTALTVIVVFCILLFAEWLSRARAVHAELTRKLVHMMVGTFVAFWPFFLSWRQILLLSMLFLVVVGASIRLNVFRAIHAVNRNNLGELLFAMVIGFLALISSSKWIFMAAMLHLSLADGLAAVVGILWGDGNKYKVLGHTKSLAGTSAFYATSFVILLLYTWFGHASLGLGLVWVPLLAAITENVAVNGIDNLVLPILIALILSSNL